MITAACGDNNDGNNDNDVQDQVDLGQQRGRVLSTQVMDDLGSDTPEVALGKAGQIMLTIDQGEIMEAQLIVDSDFAVAPEVLDYANRMIEEHTMHQDATNALLDASGATPMESDVDNQIQSDAMAGLRELQNANEDTIDLVYMRLQVRMHAEASVIVGTLEDLDLSDQAQAFFANTRNQIDDHRSDAEDILRDL